VATKAAISAEATKKQHSHQKDRYKYDSVVLEKFFLCFWLIVRHIKSHNRQLSTKALYILKGGQFLAHYRDIVDAP